MHYLYTIPHPESRLSSFHALTRMSTRKVPLQRGGPGVSSRAERAAPPCSRSQPIPHAGCRSPRRRSESLREGVLYPGRLTNQITWAKPDPPPAPSTMPSPTPSRRGVEQSGSSSGSKAGGRRFKSCPRYQYSCGRFRIEMNDRRGD